MSAITVKEAARMLAVSPMTVRRLIDSGRLPAWRVIESEDVETLKVPARKETS